MSSLTQLMRWASSLSLAGAAATRGRYILYYDSHGAWPNIGTIAELEQVEGGATRYCSCIYAYAG
jgi:hypothetical protein